MSDTAPLAERFTAFAETQAAGSSPSFESWARSVAADPDVLAVLASLPREKQQPNLVFAAARWHGAEPGDAASLRRTLLHDFDAVGRTIRERSTQTNEPARGAILAWGLARLPGPIALIEIGASAGLVLAFDRYTYRFPGGEQLGPTEGAAQVAIDVGMPRSAFPPTLPDVSWRAGLDVNPLDPADPDTRAWLTTLIWPEHTRRRARLDAALGVAAGLATPIHPGNLLEDLASIAAQAPPEATLVCFHSATLAYLEPADRVAAIELMRSLGHWLSFEATGIVPGIAEPDAPPGSFIAALDGVPFATATGHAAGLAVVA